MADWQVIQGDCLDVLRGMEPESVDAIVTDPPYGLEFMGKEWDRLIDKRESRPSGTFTDKPRGEGVTSGGDRTSNPYIASRVTYVAGAAMQAWHEQWAREAYRVLKPGGHMLAFGGTRTSHRMVCAIEDAGFEIRDSVVYMYGSGFPKSLNVSKALAERTQRCICTPQAVQYNHDNSDVRDLRQDISEARRMGEAGSESLLLSPMQREGSRPGVGEARSQGPSGLDRSEPSVLSGKDERSEQPGLEGRGHVLAEARELSADQVHPLPGRSASDGPQGQLCNGTSGHHGANGRPPATTIRSSASSRPQPAEQPATEPRTVALESGTQTSGAWPNCPRCGLPVIPDGLGTALKPSHEPICVARKPLSESTVAANVLRWGTGAINVDAGRVGFQSPEDEAESKGKNRHADYGSGPCDNRIYGADERTRADQGNYDAPGRWPANACFDEAAAAMLDARSNGASRFFYVAKASRTERNAGLEGMPEREQGQRYGSVQDARPHTADDYEYPRKPMANSHPTVKPIALMRWLVRLVTPPGGVVLDPFAGSGSTGCAAVLEGVRFLGIEQDAEYCEIARRRIAHWAAQTPTVQQTAFAADTLGELEPITIGPAAPQCQQQALFMEAGE